jgi:hypothetical protein
MLDMARNRPTPPSLADPPDWLPALQGFEMFHPHDTDHGVTFFPEGIDETTEFPGGTWRVTMIMPVNLSLTEGSIDPLVLLAIVADGAAKVDDKLQDLVAFARKHGKSWTEIGRALGMTKQSAWERFSGED